MLNGLRSFTKIVVLWCLWIPFCVVWMGSGCGVGQGELRTNLKNNTLLFPSVGLFEIKKASIFLYKTRGASLTITSLSLHGEKAVNYEITQGVSVPFILEGGKDKNGKQNGSWIVVRFFASH